MVLPLLVVATEYKLYTWTSCIALVSCVHPNLVLHEHHASHWSCVSTQTLSVACRSSFRPLFGHNTHRFRASRLIARVMTAARCLSSRYRVLSYHRLRSNSPVLLTWKSCQLSRASFHLLILLSYVVSHVMSYCSALTDRCYCLTGLLRLPMGRTFCYLICGIFIGFSFAFILLSTSSQVSSFGEFLIPPR